METAVDSGIFVNILAKVPTVVIVLNHEIAGTQVR